MADVAVVALRAGETYGGADVRVELTDGDGTPVVGYADGAIVAPFTVQAHGLTGAATLHLIPNASISPANTYYTVTIGDFSMLIEVGSGGGALEDLLVTDPAALAPTMLTAHLTDTTDAHDASAVSFVPNGTIAATNVQAAIQEVRDEASALAEPVALAHIADTSAAHAATAVSFTPNGNIAATDVQAAVQEVRDDAATEVAAEAALARNADNLTSGTVADARVASTIARDSEVAAAYQPLDSDLTAIAALSTTAYGRAVLELANQAALSALVDHGGVAGLSDDDHTQYVLVAGTRTSAQVVLQAGNAAHIPLIVKGAAAQSGNLQQWQNSVASVLASVSAAGWVGIGTTPGKVLDVLGTGTTEPITSGAVINVSDSRAYAAGVGGGINFSGKYNAAGAITELAGIRGGKTNATDGDYGGTLTFYIRANGASTWLTYPRMIITTAGVEIPVGLTLTDATNLIVGSTTGTKIATATTQKLGFWNATPVVQPTNVTNPTGGATVDAEARTAIDDILSRLETIGLFAA